MKNKKIFPAIIALISLSLLGIIFVQVSWIKTQAELKEDQLVMKLFDVTQEVGEELVSQTGSKFNSLAPIPGMKFPGDAYDIYRQYSVANRFTLFEVKEKVNKAFLRHGLKDTKFEFAIASDNIYGHYPSINSGGRQFAGKPGA